MCVFSSQLKRGIGELSLFHYYFLETKTKIPGKFVIFAFFFLAERLAIFVRCSSTHSLLSVFAGHAPCGRPDPGGK